MKAALKRHGMPPSSQIGRHHRFAVARLNGTVAIQNLNCSIATRYVLDQASVVCAIPSIALCLKRPADSVAILKYCVPHDVFLHEQRPARCRASISLLLLLASFVGLVTLRVRTLGVLLRTRRMLHALGMIALAVLFRGSPVRLSRIFMKFGGFVVIAICHVKAPWVQPSGRTNRPGADLFLV